MLLKTVLIFFIFIGTSASSISQIDSTSIENDGLIMIPTRSTTFGPTLGFRGFKNSIAEVGFMYADVGHGIVGIEISYMTNFKLEEQKIDGFSLGYFKGFAYFETGINATMYTNYNQYRVYLRPYLGLGIGGILTIGYGYNFSIGKNIFKDEISPHEVRIIGRLPIGL